MKSKFYFQTFLICFLMWGVMANSARGQCSNCSNPDPNVSMTITVVQEPVVCQNYGQAKIRIQNNSGTAIDFFNPLELCLDDPGENDILFTGLVNPPSGLTVVSGNNSSNPTFDYSGNIGAGSFLEFTISIKGACELMDKLADGNTDDFINNSIYGFLFFVDVNPPSLPKCVSATSESFDVDYLLVSVGECNTVTNANIGEPFSMTFETDISGEFCRKGFQVCVEAPSSVDLSNVVPTASGINGSANINPNTFTWNGNVFCFTVGSVFNPFGIGYCEDNYPSGMGEFTITLNNLVVNECDNQIPITLTTNTCNQQAYDLTCYANFPIGQSSATCFVNVPLGNPNVNITASVLSGALDFCNGDATIKYEVDNNSTDPSDNAFGLIVTVQNYQWMNVNFIDVGNMSVPLANLATFNLTNSVAGTNFITLSGNDVIFNFNNLASPGFGGEDLDGDGVYSELSINNSFWVGVNIDSDCPFEDDLCFSNWEGWVVRGNVQSKNQCETFTENDWTGQHYLDVEIGNAYFDPLPGPIVQPNFTVNFCFDDGATSITGDDLPWFDLGNFNLDFTHTVNKNKGTPFTITALHYTDEEGNRNTVYPNPKKAGTVFTFAKMMAFTCMELEISYDCPPEGGYYPLEISIEPYGYYDNCIDCHIKLGCLNTSVLVECPCDPMVYECEGCEFVSTTGVDAFRTTGTNINGAYPCDEIEIHITGTIQPGYNGILSACYGLYDDDYGLLTAGAGELILNGGTPIPLTNLGQAPPWNPGMGNLTILFNEYISNVNITTPTTVEVIIYATVDLGAVNALPAGVYPMAVYGALGEYVEGQTVKCGLEAEFFDIYEVKTNWSQVSYTGNCNDTLKVPFRLLYNGGTNGDDFPGEYRPYNQFFGDLSISATNGFTVLGIQQGNNYHWNSSISNIENFLDPPSDKLSFLGVSQQFFVLLEGGCNLSSGGSITVDGFIQEDIYSPACSTTTSFSRTRNFGYVNGDITTNAVNTPISTYQRCVTLTTESYAVNHASSNVWIQFEIPPGLIESVSHNGTPLTLSGTNPEIWSFTVPGGVAITPATVLEFEVCFDDACDYQPLEIPYYIGKVCEPAEIPNPATPHDVTEGCIEDSDVFVVSFEESGLDMDVNQCNELDENFCGIVYYSVSLSNPGGGNTGDMHFSVDLPFGYEVAELYYTYPSSSVSSCNNGTCAGGNDISSLISDLIGPNGINLGAANILPDNGSISAAGELPGVQSGANDAARRINFCVGVRANCNAIIQTGDLVFHASGRRPCGSVIEVENNQFTDPLDDWYVAGIDAEISINAPVNLDCKLGVGNVQITINWPAGLVVPPYQTFFLQIFSDLNIPGIIPVTYVPGNNPQIILIPFQYDPELPCDTRGIVSANLMTEAILPCGNTECQVSYSIDSDFASFELNNGRIEVSSLEISDELCPQIEPDFGTITFQLTNYTATGGMPATVQYFCDANQDGIPDGSAFASLNINLPPTGTSTTVTLNIQESVFWAGCPSGNIVALLSFPHAKCICVEGTLTASDCCECPEFEIDFVNLGGNAYEFTLTPSDYITWIFEWSYPGGSQFVNATTNPFVIDFDDYGGFVPDEICSRIESLMEDCDSTKTAKSIVTDPPCSQKICFNLDECYAKASFTYTIVDQTWGSADVLLNGTVNTNMNPYFIYWYVNGVQVGSGNPYLVTLPTGIHEICMVVAGVYNGEECKFEECKRIEIKDDCKDLDPNFTYSAEGPNDFGYLFEANAVLSDPNAYHSWYIALSDESCKIVQPIGIIEGESMSTYLEECQYYVIVHRVKTENCEACYARCIFICDGRSSGRDEELGNFDCRELDNYEWKTIGFDGNGPDFSKSEGSKLLDEEILISPNPVSSNARISWSLKDVEEMVISDFTGNRVAYHKLNGEQSFELETTDMHQGIYFVRIKNIHGDYLVKRFEVIRH